VDGQADLLEVVGALHAVGRLAHLLHGGQEQADQDGDDGNHHQQLDQGKSRPFSHGLTQQGGMRQEDDRRPARQAPSILRPTWNR
jgi:hypothetical protein